ncbi:pyridoxal phosphate-dependent aminotransferase [Magnetofaba australis]|uniref:Aminotransferase n=1 Tax=Magnetofaba australis IT-1 TaxID=1434232 RepID=A0A1Y2K1L6_9PROT|nr:pyridoxal phosphate-dependent aminotransferase [Magnetofaba australis]OSM01872.1 putative L-aspartate aminotransferase [Magnetofaba australis IT-1]
MGILSERVQQVKPSATLAITAKAKALKAAGKDVIGLGSGEPDFDTPEHIKEAAIKSLRDGFTKYTPVPGVPALREAVAAKYLNECKLEYAVDETIITVGGKQAFYNLAQATINPGDEVIIPSPYWVSYPDMTILAGGKPVLVDCGEENGFRITPDQLDAAITPKTKYLVLCSPSNPTGSAYPDWELKDLAEVLRKHPHVWVISDDIYEKIVYDGFKFHNILTVAPDLKDRTVILNGVAKAYSMTGWRIGYAVGPADVIKGMSKIQGQSTSNATSFAQMGALAALTGDQGVIKPMLEAFVERRDYVVKRLNAMPGVSCRKPEGAFYAYPSVKGFIGKPVPGDEEKIITDSLVLADYLLEAVGVAIVPGVAFGLDPFFRLSYATSMEDLVGAMDRLEKVAQQLAES